MQPLIEKTNPFDPTEEYLADLIRASEPVALSTARKQRVLNGVLLRQQQPRRSSPLRLLRPVFVVGVLSLAGAATAAATIGRRVWNERHPAPAASPPAASAPAVPAKRARSTRVAVAIAEGSPSLAPEPVASVRPPRRAPKASGRVRVASAPKSEDPSRVVDAIHALRNDHDPVRAGRLLSEYLTRYPRGALAEEAVALSIEAAAANHSPAAAAFAERYLRQYPHGRFRHTAEQALVQRAN